MYRFYFHRSCSHEFVHCGHVKRTKNEAKLGLRIIHDETLSAVSEMLAKNCPTALANQFLRLLTGGRLTTWSSNSMRNCALARKNGSNPDETTTEILIRLLKSNEDIEHVRCSASCNESLDFVKAHKQRKNVKNVTD